MVLVRKFSTNFTRNGSNTVRWDALISGLYSPIFSAEKGGQFPNKNFARFRRRPPHFAHTPEARARVQQLFLETSKKIICNIHCSRNRIENGLPGTTYTMGIVQQQNRWRGDGKSTYLSIGFEQLEPLMSINLNPTERALEVFRLAVIILHETAVRCSYLVAFY